MNMQLRIQKIEGTTVLEVGGEVELANAPQLRSELLGIGDVEHPRIVVDLSQVTFIDSTGIGVLVGAIKRVRERQGELALVCPQPRVRRIFEITGLLRALSIFETRDAALHSLTTAKSADLREA